MAKMAINYTDAPIDGAVSANAAYFTIACRKAKLAYVTPEQTEIKEAYEAKEIEVKVVKPKTTKAK